MVDQEKIHNQCLSDDPKVLIHALEKFKSFFSLIPDKQQAWNDLHRLTNDECRYVRSKAADALGSVFSDMPDKQQAWDDLHRLTTDEDSSVRKNVAGALGSVFSHVPDKQQAWDDLHRLTTDEDSSVRKNVAGALGSVFSHVPDKQQAWNDLIRLSNDENYYVRYNAAFAFVSAFSQVLDKQQAWNDLIRLTNVEDSYVRSNAVKAFGSAFSQVSDKQWAWNNLIKLTNDEDLWVKFNTSRALGSAFSQVSDKQQAWNDLHRLANDESNCARYSAAFALGFAFSNMPDKQRAWNDLIRLTNDKESDIRYRAAKALGSAFSDIPDEQQAWNDLHILTNDKDSYVRSNVAYALGSAFSQLPDRQQARDDLYRLTKDKSSDVRTSSNHSLGRVSIFIASQAETEENYKKELEKAIKFFETAAQEASRSNPAQFCLPFYRSFHTIIFKKQEAREEVNKYLEEAKDAVEDSESKKQLFEAVQNLAEALKEVQNLENLDLQAMKGELSFYRKYCDHAAELMKCTDEKAPFATRVLRKGLPILDRNLKAIIEEIQEKAKNTYKQSQGTVTEEIAYSVCREVQKWEMGSPEEMTQKVEDIAYVLKKKIGYVPENEYVLNKIEAMRYERNLVKQYETLLFVIEQIPTMKVISEQELDQKFQKFDRIFDEIIYVKNKLNCISFDVSKIKLNSADVISDLETMKTELEKLSKIEGLNTLSIEKLDSIQAEKINGFNNNILGRLDEIKILIHELSKDNSDIYEEYSRRLNEIKQSKLDTLLQRYSAVISLIGFVISGISIAH
ncbi:HEAT repeat domain-containing protein [Methanosarcina sp.]|uniref:HEAT repeat domain-containing protein n=1 Tax=Methanosarcina sp. TaxID=2213 RepID=UPI002988B72F|nr:HEAT repeat domain-containing protein [Methanosarcina sp.]MDW5551212.1 HEAT repeat domain-containing protein [Methanosarcina sp.]MDW5555056.1 HEAT repeat domain-containing protein [Methanosarcina sp.]MDW5560739.1 HEAT repeat domain-containing protein [Methanosarcina sp.]